MDEQERFEALLGRGYLPKELPPAFQSHSFANKTVELKSNFSAYLANLSKKKREAHPLPSHPVHFDMARRGHSRRTLSIPNPVNQFFLAREISLHWDAISARIHSSPYSLTNCDLSLRGRAIGMPSLSLLAEKRIIAYAGQGAILQTDILSFYHSIYTHAVPWAIHGKIAAKENRNPQDPAMYGNRIDFLLRSCQDGQTIGVPVGPDTSRIISELMLCAVEDRLRANSGAKIVNGLRYVDDFFLCFDSLADAEAALAVLREACLHFDLQLNAAKTSTTVATAFNESTWASNLSATTIPTGKKAQRRALMRFFSEVIALTKTLPDESIPSFAVRKSAKVKVHKENWDIYLSFLLRVGQEHGNCLDSVVKIICTYVAAGYPILECIHAFIDRLVIEHALYNHHFEVSWLLWMAISLNIRLTPNASKLIFRIENDICAILALHMRQRRLVGSSRELSSWLGPVSSEDLLGSHWLLIYEAALHDSWAIEGAKAAVDGDPFFSTMHEKGVSFYTTLARNRPVNIPDIKPYLWEQLGQRRRGLLPGNIWIERDLPTEEEYEELGADYDEEDDDFSVMWRDDEDDEDYEGDL
ncbi:RNA-directed DNA polymerase [Paraburkholderia aspalathi]|uniref:RNA-directed DNA polymerase n=1 Tax=Paraburkholderia aspalathi TaxID=1324617 RepID=UPI003C873087